MKKYNSINKNNFIRGAEMLLTVEAKKNNPRQNKKGNRIPFI